MGRGGAPSPSTSAVGQRLKMDARTLIAKVRKGEAPTSAELCWFAQGLADGGVADVQAAAFAMAVCLNGLGAEQRVALTLAMRDSGEVLAWNLPGPVLDKHSTGGVGDLVSLVLAPALAACGAFVPMISGRGLGHTGGTVDKLEAIPGYRTDVAIAELRKVVSATGCAIIGQTAQLAPADNRLYAIRDLTATIDSLDLITASILSKKLAAGLEGLVLDIKMGAGAFMKTLAAAEALAKALVEGAKGAGCPATALITDMSAPLASAAGNAVEVVEALRCLGGEAQNSRLTKVTALLGGRLLALGGLADNPMEGEKQVLKCLANGQAAERFARMVAALGGPKNLLERWPQLLPKAAVVTEIPAGRTGFVAGIDVEALGMAVVALGGGRRRKEDIIDPSVGFTNLLPLGAQVGPNTPLAIVHAADETAAAIAAAVARQAYRVAAAAPPPPSLVHGAVA